MESYTKNEDGEFEAMQAWTMSLFKKDEDGEFVEMQVPPSSEVYYLSADYAYLTKEMSLEHSEAVDLLRISRRQNDS